jgi:hypothetical protein
VIAYDAEAWHDLFVGAAGAAAALDGLLFVAVSINVKEVLATPGLPRLAARALGLLLALLLASILVLAPGQSRLVLGIEVGVLGLVLLVATIVSIMRSHQRWRWTASALLTALLSTAPMVLGGLSLMLGVGGGLYWILGELVLGFSVAIYYAWVLLIEILR